MKRKIFVFAVINGVLQIIKGLTAEQASCYSLSEALIEAGGFVVDWTAKSDNDIRQLRATFDPKYPQYNGGSGVVTLPSNYRIVRKQNRIIQGEQKNITVSTWDFTKLPSEQHKRAIQLFESKKWDVLKTILIDTGVWTPSCGACNANKQIKKWMTWAIHTKTIK